jgi:hypothetical protein
MSNTEHADYKFTVKEGQPRESGADAPTSLMCEPINHELSIVGSGFLMLNLREGTSVDDAHAVAKYLQRHVVSVSYTSP